MEFRYSVESVTLAKTCWTEGDECILSKFDEALCSEWDAAMKAGSFRYTLDHIQTKVLAGKYKFVAQLNIKRATERRKAEQISCISQPFNRDRFNFTKIKKHEILFNLKPVKNSIMNGSDINITCAIPEDEVVPKREDKIENGTDMRHDKIVNGSDVQQYTITEDERNNPHQVVINISPLEYCNILLVPHVNSCHSQVLNPKSIQLALEMILLSSKKSFRIGWNSLCAFASVNHLHFHAYYLEYDIYAEVAECRRVTGTLYESNDWPVRSFVLQLNGSNIQSLTKDVHKVTSYLHANNTAHNVYMTRGDCFDRRPGERTIRVYIWPRKSSFGAKELMSFNAAVCELAGHLPVKSEAEFETLTEETVVDILKAVRLPDKQFEDIKENIQRLFK